MTPELRDFVLALPLAVRQEIGKIDGLFWWCLTGLPGDALCEVALGSPVGVYDTPGNNRACMPASAKDVASHAASLLGAAGHSIETFADRTTATAWFRAADVEPGGRLAVSDSSASDPTGHRAAIGLLMKVMEIEKQ